MIKKYLYWGRNLTNMLFSKLLILFNFKYDKTLIPEGQYCYKEDSEKNKSSDSFVYYIIPCIYYKKLGRTWNGCEYLGIITDDFVFGDQCKMCGENNEM
jgi:hypothetical protein